MPQRNLTVIFISVLVSLMCYHKARYGRYAWIMADAMGQIVDRYVEPVDQRELFEGAMEGMVGRLDQYSGFINTAALQRLSESILDQEFGGVGIEVILDRASREDREPGWLTVLSPLVGTPAYKAGMKSGDVILEIDGQSTEGITLQDAVRLMRGEPGTEVRLSVLHLGSKTPEQISIIRDKIDVESVDGDLRGPDGQWRFYLEEHPHIGYIRLTTFGDKTVRELTAALHSFQDHPVEGLILDVRGNAGGLLTAATDACDFFIDSGQIVTTRDRDGTVEHSYKASPKRTIFRLPLVVLVDRYSASASEILAACLQDHQRAKIIGERTWGKGTVQNVIFLEGGRSAIKLTTSTYWRPSRKNIHRGTKATEDDDWGVRADPGYEVELTDKEYAKLAEASRQLYLKRVKDQAHVAAHVKEDSQDDTKSTSSDPQEPFEDPQMHKAIEYLESLKHNPSRQAA